MLQRGKFKSLIMINWNGFFARKYDLDQLVTTLSGGNGAGKSTTMAAFITALIPDLSLLHFRNTTEAGSTSSSRDRGLHGKLKSGVCYAALECQNSRGEIMVFGTRLQQISGRDKKVDIKLFSLSGIGENDKVIDLFFTQVGDKGKILNINELKAKFEKDSQIQFKPYHTLGDYHAQMFDYGFLPKRLRTPQDRSRFYRLIEASLYGGISSTITKSLREYLLPENQTVKRAFQDMESALIENRMTLNKIEQTSADRNFFRALVDASLDYVACDYVYQLNNRSTTVQDALSKRADLIKLSTQYATVQHSINNFDRQHEQLQNRLTNLTGEHTQAVEYYNLLVNATRTQQQYDDKLAQIAVLEEEEAILNEQVEDLTIQREELEGSIAQLDGQARSLQRELADTQASLNQQETRKVQYKNAMQQLQRLGSTLGVAYAAGQLPLGAYATAAQAGSEAAPALDAELVNNLQAWIKNSIAAHLLNEQLAPAALAQAQTQALEQLAEQHEVSVEQLEASSVNTQLSQTSLAAVTGLEAGVAKPLLEQTFDLDLEAIAPLQGTLQAHLTQAQGAQYQLQRALSNAATSQETYDKTLAALSRLLSGAKVNRAQAYSQAQMLIKSSIIKRNLAERLPQLDRDFLNLQSKRDALQASTHQVNELQEQLGMAFESRTAVQEQFELTQATYGELEFQRSELKDALASHSVNLNVVSNEINQLNQLRIPYYHAQEELTKINNRLPEPLTNEAQVQEAMRHYLHLQNSQEVRFKNLEDRKIELQEQIFKVERQELGGDPLLEQIAQDLGGVLLSSIYDDIGMEDAIYYSALYGPARDAVVVPSFDGIQAKLEAMQELPADLYLIQADFKEFNEDIFQSEVGEKAVLVKVDAHQMRYSSYQQATTFGRVAREKYLEQAKNELKDILYELSTLENDFHANKNLSNLLTDFLSKYAHVAFKDNPEERLSQLQAQAQATERELNGMRGQLESYNAQLAELNRQMNLLTKLSHLVTADWESSASVEEDFHRIQNECKQAREAQRYLEQHGRDLSLLEEQVNCLQFPPSDAETLKQQQAQLEILIKVLANLDHLCSEVLSRRAHFEYKDLGELEGDALATDLRKRLDATETEVTQLKTSLKDVVVQLEDRRSSFFQVNANLNAARESLQALALALQDTGTSVNQAQVDKAKAKAAELQQSLDQVKEQLTTLKNEFEHNKQRLSDLEAKTKAAHYQYSLARRSALDSKNKWQLSQSLVREHELSQRFLNPELRMLSNEELRSRSDRAQGELRSLVSDNEYLRDMLRQSEDNRQPYLKIKFFIGVYQHLRERIRQDIMTTNDPIEAIEQMEIQLERLSAQLQQREESLSISTEGLASLLDKTIQREQNRIWELNRGLQNMSFGQVKSVRLTATYRESHLLMLQALRQGRDKHADLFDNDELSFTEALAKLYQRTNVELDLGQRSFQTIGEELLDYRNYIDLGIEVFRGSDGWLKAESGALSTGEAIGTGMSILLMVVQSWEAESARIRAKDLLPCRLLFLDEAARLDSKSIATLFELCQRQQMQLLIAAPENIAPDNGTTYKLIRRIEGNKEYVHVAGLRGFGSLSLNNNNASQSQRNEAAA